MIKSCKHRHFHRERGAILFIVLMFMAFVSAMILLTHSEVDAEIELLQTESSKLQCYINCYSGFQFALNRFLTTQDNGVELREDPAKQPEEPIYIDGTPVEVSIGSLLDKDYLEGYADQKKEALKKSSFTVAFQESGGLINFFRTRPEFFKNYLKQQDVDDKAIAVVYDSIFDWMDPDDFTRMNGAEKDYYQDNGGYEPANQNIASKDELNLIRGITPQLFAKLRDYLDFNPAYSGLNPNTMPAEVFKIFEPEALEFTEERIEEIIQSRRGQPFRNLEDFTARTGFNFANFPNLFYFFTSPGFYIKITSELTEDKSFRMEATMKKAGSANIQRNPQPGVSPPRPPINGQNNQQQPPNQDQSFQQPGDPSQPQPGGPGQPQPDRLEQDNRRAQATDNRVTHISTSNSALTQRNLLKLYEVEALVENVIMTETSVAAETDVTTATKGDKNG